MHRQERAGAAKTIVRTPIQEQRMAKNWKANDWDTLIRGEHCPVYDLIQAAKPEDDHGIAVADLQLSRLFLAKNQYATGYCFLMCHKHVIEPYALTSDERTMVL